MIDGCAALGMRSQHRQVVAGRATVERMPADADLPADDTIRASLYDAPRLLALRRSLRAVTEDAEPAARISDGPDPNLAGRMALLPGSFNPPTLAHVALAHAGLGLGMSAAYFTLATRTVDKEAVSGASLDDRLLLLDMLVRHDGRLGVMVVNRGLYVDQAALVRAAFPAVTDIAFLVGFDKIVQIFDPRYYDDRDAALERLFGLARFLVAPRAEHGPDELDALLARAENRRFAHRVARIDMPTSLRLVASSAVRADGASAHDQLPPECRAFVEETGAYDADGTRYGRRQALLAELECHAGRQSDAELRARFRSSRR